MSTHSTPGHDPTHAVPGQVGAHDTHGAHAPHGGHSGHDGHGHHHRHGYDFAHPFPVWGLLAVFFALVFLTIITVAQASFDLGSYEILASMIIASIKATLVVFFFMHLVFDKSYNAIIFVTSLVFVALFLSGTLFDSQTTRELIIVNTGENEQVAAP